MNKKKLKELFHILVELFSLQALSHLMVHVFAFIPLMFGIVLHSHDHNYLAESITLSVILNFTLHIVSALAVVERNRLSNLNNPLKHHYMHN